MFVAKAIRDFSNLNWLLLILHLFDELCQLQENDALLETDSPQLSTMPDRKGLKKLWLILLRVLAPLQLYAKSSMSLMMRQSRQMLRTIVLTLLPMVESVLSFPFLPLTLRKAREDGVKIRQA